MATVVAEKTGKTRIGRFIVQRLLGSGLQGAVYLAFDPDLERLVAVKILKPHNVSKHSPAMKLRPAEARIVARLAHPNVIPLYEMGLHQDIPYLVFAYVDGTTLGRRLKEHRILTVAEGLTLFRPILDGMAHAHGHGILHLDLSPANIMLDKSGVPRIMDFGLAKIMGRDTDNSAHEDLIGTPCYMSPEHFNGDPFTPRTDVFALGLILYEILVGKAAFKVDSLHSVIRAIADGRLDFGELEKIGLDPDLQAILQRALSHDARSRYADAGEMKRALDAWCEREAGDLRPHGTVEFLLRRMQRKADFPALSNNLLEINRLTDESSLASADTLAKVVLRDYAITNKLLKLANSSFYGRAGQGVKTISGAIRLLGMKQVRMTCNGLMYFQHLQSGQSDLQDAQVSSFVSALIARHLAVQTGRKDLAEEAFICGLFHKLGKSLSIFYFGEEYREIEHLVASESLPEEVAAHRVLGIGYSDLGVAVAETWKFPEAIRHSMQYPGPGVLPKAVDVAQTQQQYAAFANELCQLTSHEPPGPALERLAGFTRRFESLVAVTPSVVVRLLGAALDKFGEFAPILGIDGSKSAFVRRTREFVQMAESTLASQRAGQTTEAG